LNFINPISQHTHYHIQLVEHDPCLPRLGSRVRVSFPAPISLRSPHFSFELPFTSRSDDLSYPAFSRYLSFFLYIPSHKSKLHLPLTIHPGGRPQPFVVG